jgi:hypothetical protein
MQAIIRIKLTFWRTSLTRMAHVILSIVLVLDHLLVIHLNLNPEKFQTNSNVNKFYFLRSKISVDDSILT